ncbi:hypothetical protein PAPYR_7593 [Paratrimastix pyriformis]|uniref:Uncharacterized protein n=1 Tax=Paratrimastix pyriformis TaxID=342808 RepID=A0ABQ8UG15_9EUKA|nr:hypothetical protein PAPYR_7593 [Paratrimastix pyriformis]
MGDVVYPGPPDYLCFLFDSQQAAPPLGVGSASCCPVRTKMGLTAISIGLRWVNFHPFRGADRWAGTVASFLEISITVFDGGTLRLVRPWPMAGVRSFPSVVLPPFGVGAARGARVVLFLVRAGRYAVRMPL